MAKYKLTFVVNASRIDALRSQLAKNFPGQEVLVDKIDMNPSRADRLSAVQADFENAKEEVQSLQDEMEQWYDSLPENLQNSDKASSIEECKSALEDLVSNMDQCEFDSIEFPQMMG